MKPRWHEMTAVFGGTFDPPHQGHREAVLGLFSFPGVQKVRILPSPIPPHKTSFATVQQRLEMVKINFSNFPEQDLEIDTREIERAERFPNQPTYSFDTLSEIRREIPNLAFVIGIDQLEKLDTWHRFPEVLHLSHWIVLLRKPEKGDRALQALSQWASSGLVRAKAEHLWQTSSGNWIQLAPTEARAISSTAIRESVSKTGQAPQGALLPEVESYLKLHRIYGMQ